MTYTRHGHQIPNTTVEEDRPPVARCGGPGLCPQCSIDLAAVVMGQERASTPERHNVFDKEEGDGVPPVHP